MGYTHGYPSVYKPCENCREIFKAHVNAIEKNHDRFCSRRCANEFLYGKPTIKDKFFKFSIVPEDPDACWPWTGTIAWNGYGQINIRGVTYYNHRMSWEIHCGPIPEGMSVCHKCDIRYPIGSKEYRKCGNYNHLFLGTHQDNMKDRDDKMRQAHGTRQWMAKLTDDDVRQIRSLLKQGIMVKEICKRFGVTKGPIWKIAVGQSWKHVH